MILSAPSYYKEFHCIADKCKENCCAAGWEIDIDKQTANYYKNLPGELGEKLRDNIDFGDKGVSKQGNEHGNKQGNKGTSSNAGTNVTPHFKLNKHGKCAFLTKNNLCELYSKLGADKQAYICREHPRYYEWFNNVKEAGIGLCCEEAARIILTQTQKFSTYQVEIQEENTDTFDENLYEYLLESRKKIIDYLEKPNYSLASILNYVQNIQDDIADGWLIDEEIENVNAKTSTKKLKKLITYFSNLESNNAEWSQNFKNSVKHFDQYENEHNNFQKANPELHSKYLKNIAIYFVWRYYMKATYDEDVLSKIKIIISSVYVIEYLLFARWLEKGQLNLQDYIEISKKYSEQVEYSEDNLKKITKECELPIDFCSE